MSKFLTLIISFTFILLFSSVANAPDVPQSKLPQQEQCHALNAYYEARSEGIKGMMAVIKVVNNRVKASGYPSTPCGVIFQRKQFSWTHQQSYRAIDALLMGDITGLNAREIQAYNTALILAYSSDLELSKVLPEAALYYHTRDVRPAWSNTFKRIKVLGVHIFYSK
jgi:spore germination cell wall hydrolase CwlJ-like protein